MNTTMGSAILKFLIVVSVPAATAVAFFPMRETREGGLALLCAAFTAVLAAYVMFFSRSRATIKVYAAAVADAEERHARERAELRTRIDFLAAEREISLVLNEDVDYETVVDKVLTITNEALGGRKDDIIELYHKDPREDVLVHRATRTEGKTRFERGEKSQPPPSVTASFEHGRTMFLAEDQFLEVVAPLSSDRELIGAVRVRTLLQGDATFKSDRAERLSRNLGELSRFIALALKTPGLYLRAVEDALTGLATRRHFQNMLDSSILNAVRYKEPLSLIMLDIDHFKQVNDQHGHPAGDAVLQGVAEIVRQGIRKGSDAAGFRYGGEELGLLLPKTPMYRAAEVAERLRKRVENAVFAEGIQVTVSIGVSAHTPGMSPGDFISKADEALYRAKEGGRNRVAVARTAGA